MFTQRVIAALQRIEALDGEQKASGEGIPFWRVSGENGRLLHILCRSTGARRAVEIGTSSGYSGIHIASALDAANGHLWTFEQEPFKLDLARRSFEDAGLSALITQVAGDVLQTLPAFLAAGGEPVDFAFLDAVKTDYLRYLEILRPHLRTGSVVCADNVGAPQAEAVAPYLAALERGPFITSIVPTRNAETLTDALAVSIFEG